jgi:hypothetical protein
MFRIKAKQIDAFVAFDEGEFEKRIAQRLQLYFDTLAGASHDELIALVRLGRERANAYGITSHHDVALYVGVMAQLGVDFDASGQFPWATEMLRNDAVDAATKMAFLCVRARLTHDTKRPTNG